MDIIIDAKTKAMLQEIDRAIKDLEVKRTIILQVCLNANGIVGEDIFDVAPDFSKFTKRENGQEK